MSLSESLVEEITGNLDARRLEITNLRRIVQNYVGKALEATAVRMAIPMLYAQWEGYIREVCQLYLECIEKSGMKVRELRADLVAHLWTGRLKPLVGGVSFEKKRDIALLALTSLDTPVKFAESERMINTKSNLSFDVLEDIADHLCLDITGLNPSKRHLDALVHIRNNIAHGSRPRTLDVGFFEEQATFLLKLMEDFEHALIDALETQRFTTNPQ
jgi:hypothetical protein